MLCRNLLLCFVVSSAALAEERPLNFNTDIVPVLSKYGCNSGSCHGKAIGQNGFKLSLFGFDPGFDYVAIAHESRGRRVSPAAPDDSLLLLKISGGMAHGGGVRFTVDSEPYKLLRRWIEAGLPEGTPEDPTETKLEVSPADTLATGKQSQQLKVVAHYSDGTTRDVTKLARYDSQTPEILAVSFEGVVGVPALAGNSEPAKAGTPAPAGDSGPAKAGTPAPAGDSGPAKAGTPTRLGEGYVMIRYQDLVATARVTLPYGPPLADDAYKSFAPKSFVDEKVLAKWKKLGIGPSGECTDAEFIRRLFLDVLGTLPTPQEVRDFLANASPDKREKLIDTVLERPEYADYWAQRWGEILRNKQGDGAFKDHTTNLAKWVRQSLAENKPYDRFVREILTATGKRTELPQMDWWRQAISNPVRVEDSAQAFLGLRVSCANCHNHPFEHISQTDYWRYAAFFAKVGSVTYGSVDEIKLNEEGVVKHPRTEQPLSPQAFGGGAKYEFVKGEDPRQKLVDWMASPENPYFARAVVNRYWGHYLKLGLVDPVDDMRATNPPSNPELLDALAKDFIEHKFDLKHLQRTILKSRVYSLSSLPTEQNQADTRNYARHYPQRLRPHVLMDAISFATGTESKFDDFADVKRAILLPNEKGRSDFLDMFGRSQRDTPCECETSIAPNLGQVLYLLHSEDLQRKLADKNGFVAKFLESEKPANEVVDEVFLRTFSRLPTAFSRALALLEPEKDKKSAAEDLLWTLMNAKEFLFNR